jgi:hypothetical protein
MSLAARGWEVLLVSFGRGRWAWEVLEGPVSLDYFGLRFGRFPDRG